MKIQELSPEQISEMTLEEKDQWWLKNIYKGDMPQLNLRSALTGMILGAVLSLTNLYIGIRTGWSLGVGISSVILSYAIFRLMAKMGIGREMTILENNAMQSIATSAGYMTAPLMASMPAYMLVTHHVVPMWQTFWWIIVLAILGVLFAFPLKRRFINDEQLPFPEGRAAGIVLNNLHDSDGADGVFKAKILLIGATVSAVIETMKSQSVMRSIHLTFLQLPDYWDDFIYKFATPAILGTPMKDLTIQIDTSIVMLGSGGLMNIKTGVSLLVGAILNYFILAPIMIHAGVIHGSGFKNITMWSLWGGAAMMTTSSFYSFFSKPQVFIEAFKKPFQKSKPKNKALKHIELPTWVFVTGIPIVGALTVYLGHEWFGIEYWLGLIAIPLVFLFTLIAVTSTGLTAITPGGAIGKLTQITYSVLSPGNMPTNLMTAGISGEVSLNASNLLMDIKPAYMLGGKPRHQAVGHVLGVFVGALVAVPVFYFLFHNDLNVLTSDKMPLPGATVWKAVAEVLTQGLSAIHPTAQIAVLVGAILGILFEFLNTKMKGRFPVSGVGIGLAFVLRFTDSFSIAMGSILFWLAQKSFKDTRSWCHRVFVENQETLSAGIIAGGSIIGILLMILETMIL